MKLIAFILIFIYSAPLIAANDFTTELNKGESAPFSGYLITVKAADKAFQLDKENLDLQTLIDQERAKSGLIQQKLDIQNVLDKSYEVQLNDFKNEEADRRKVQPFIYLGCVGGGILVTVLAALALGFVAKSQR